MTLKEYLAATKTPVAAMAGALKVSEATVYRWMSGKRDPSFLAMRDVHRVTFGAVSPNDWVLEASA